MAHMGVWVVYSKQGCLVINPYSLQYTPDSALEKTFNKSLVAMGKKSIATNLVLQTPFFCHFLVSGNDYDIGWCQCSVMTPAGFLTQVRVFS